MAESSNFAAKIKETTAAIELNMKTQQSPSNKKIIDMTLIEQIK